MNSSDKLVVITGASGGLGRSLASEFVSAGWKVIGTGRSERPEQLDSEVAYFQFDSSNADACAAFWNQMKNENPNTAICLVNNAGGYIGGGLLETKPEDFARQMQSNYFSAVYMTHGLAESFDQARIINIISASALVAGGAKDSAYGASKAAEKHFFQSLQKEFKPEQYQITNLYPNSIATGGPDPKAIDPSDLAEVVRQLAENNKSYYLRDVSLYSTIY
jgi:NAD(P)-dependent dehydrogenase (short-subunit alcohol dehydrogenase family)